jgi:hypothetical protein
VRGIVGFVSVGGAGRPAADFALPTAIACQPFGLGSEFLDGVAVVVVIGGEVLAEVVEVDGGEGWEEAEGLKVGGLRWEGGSGRGTIRIRIKITIRIGWGGCGV